MNTATIQQIEKFLRLANKDDYTRKHTARVIDKMGGINLVQVNDLIKNLEYITGNEKEV